MSLKFKEDQSEEYYRKLLLLDKVRPFLNMDQLQYIFDKKYCWDLLFKDADCPKLCLAYAEEVLKGPFPEGEKYIATSVELSYWYAVRALNCRFHRGEKIIFESPYHKKMYLQFLERVNQLYLLKKRGIVEYKSNDEVFEEFLKLEIEISDSDTTTREIFNKYTKATNPVTKASYREILKSRIETFSKKMEKMVDRL